MKTTILILWAILMVGLLFYIDQNNREIERTTQQIERLHEMREQITGPTYKYEA